MQPTTAKSVTVCQVTKCYSLAVTKCYSLAEADAFHIAPITRAQLQQTIGVKFNPKPKTFAKGPIDDTPMTLSAVTMLRITAACVGVGVWGLGFGVWGSVFGVWGLGFEV